MKEKITYFFVTNANNEKISCDYLDADDALDDFMDIDEETYVHAKVVGSERTILLAWWKPGMENIETSEEYRDYYYD